MRNKIYIVLFIFCIVGCNEKKFDLGVDSQKIFLVKEFNENKNSAEQKNTSIEDIPTLKRKVVIEKPKGKLLSINSFQAKSTTFLRGSTAMLTGLANSVGNDMQYSFIKEGDKLYTRVDVPKDIAPDKRGRCENMGR